VAKVNEPIRELIQNRSAVSVDEVEALDFTDEHTKFEAEILLSLVREPGDAHLARRMFEKAVDAVVHWWNLDRRSRGATDRVPHEQLHSMLDRVARYALRLAPSDAVSLCAPILDSVDDHYREVAAFIRDLIVAEDAMRTGENFWLLWQEFANRIATASWLEHLSSDYPGYDELLGAIFLGLSWSKEIKHWPPIDGHAERLDSLVLALPAHHRVLDEYVRFLYCIGEQSLPAAFKTVAEILRNGDPKSLLSQSDTVFCLARLLQHHVYGSPRQLKVDPDLRRTVLELLDHLVESGSSAAYRMRDDFVTPLAAS
jgi:hypothetical protein